MSSTVDPARAARGAVRAAVLALAACAAGCQEASPPPPAEPADLAQTRAGLRQPSDNIGDLFLGQLAPIYNAVNLLDGRGLNNPETLALDTSVSPPRLYLADTSNNRVLAWANAAAFANGAPADKVIGQPNFLRGACNVTGLSASSLCGPKGVEVDPAGNLYVADTSNNRVLEFDTPFTTDAVADRVFGQSGNLLSNTCNLGGAVTASTLCAPVSLSLDAAGSLYVSDQSNHRLLRFDTPLLDQVADLVLGQPSMTQNAPNLVDSRGLSNPNRVALDRSVTPNRIYVADTDNHRILGWTSATTFTNGAPANLVIGQPDFATSSCNTGGLSASSLCFPRGLAVDAGGNLYVADTGNNRVLEYNTPFTSGGVADRVFGQAGFTAGTCTGASNSSVCGPYGVAIGAGGDLYVADSGYNRVLKWTGGLAGDAIADAVWGQAGSFTTTTCNTGGVSASSLCNPRGVVLDGSGNLFIADYGNSRVLQYNASPADDVADRVFGQASNMTTTTCNNGGRTASSLCNPGTVAVDGSGNVWIGDEGNSRVLGYTTPLTTDTVADKVVGKSSLTASSCSPLSSTCIVTSTPTVATDASSNLYVVDPANNRVLGFDNPYTTGNTIADRVLGQPDFLNGQRNWVERGGLNGPSGVHVDRSASPNRLYVADTQNSRVLAWGSVGALTNGLAPDKVFGQPTDISGVCANGGTSATSLCRPMDVTTDAAGNIYVSDTAARVLEYNAPYATGGDTTADKVLGQTTFTGAACNTGGVSALTLCNPRGVTVDPAGNLLVVDTGNHRLLRYDTPLVSDASADVVLGQTGYRYNGANLVDGSGLYTPYGVAVDTSVTPNRLYVTEYDNSRVLGWADVTSFVDGAPADLVLGQPDLFTSGCNSQGLSAASLCNPTSVAVDSQGRVYVSDNSNDRVLLYDSPFTTDTVADKVLGQADLTVESCNRGLAAPSAVTLCAPYGVAVDPSFNVYVADRSNHRILVYNTPWTTDATADLVIGQPDFTTALCNNGGISASRLCNPYHLAVDSSAAAPRLYVADESNNRVLEFDSPLTTDTVADMVIGQASFSSSACAVSLTGLCTPKGVTVDSIGTVYVGDNSGNRVVQYNAPRATGDVSADRIYGQSTTTGSSCNSGGVTNSSLCAPRGVATDASGNLYVVDTNNNRVVVYLGNNRPTAASVTLSPSTPRTLDDLVGTYSYQDADGDPQGATEIRWYKDGAEQTAYFGLLTVPNAATTRGEQWWFTVHPYDGIEYGHLVSSPRVTIANTPPSAASPVVTPAVPRTDDALQVSYAYADADADPETGSEIRWFLNNVEQTALANARTVPATATTKGQVWYFTLRPNDGTDLGTQVTSPVVTIANSAPSVSNVQILPASPRSTDSLTPSYVFSDPDGDTELGSVIHWYKNGTLQPALDGARTVPAPLTLGDSWYYTLQPRDGTDLGAVMTSTTVVVGSSAPAATNVQITPSPAKTDDILTASYTYSDPDLQPETSSQIRWFKGGVLQSAYNNLRTVPASATTRGDVWSFTVTPCDPTPLCGASQTSPNSTIANTAPVANSPAITPSAPKTDDVLTANYSYADADADLESGSEIHWFRNGIEQVGLLNQRTVPIASTTRGDSWYFVVRPKDGSDFGTSVTATAVVIANTAPVASALAISPASPTATDTLTASYTYSDADGDPQSGSVIRWFKNNVEDTTLLNQLTVPPSKLVKGQAWKFSVQPKDGTTLGTTVTSTAVTIANSPPVAASPVITPSNPAAGDALTATYSYGDADGDAQSGSEIRWFANGVERTTLFNLTAVPAGTTVRGERWYFTVRPKDGTAFGAPVTSPTVSIANNAPLASNLSIQPAQPRTDDALVARYVYSDADADPESGTEVRWFRNGVEATAYADLKTLPASATTKGESWYVTVKPKDGLDFGQLLTSAPVLILNTAPRATSVTLLPLSPRATDALTASYSYSDADGDPQQGTLLKWFRNDVEVTSLAGQTTVPAGTARSGETWRFTVQPKDGVDFGTEVASISVIVGSSAPVATALQVTPFSPRTDDPLTVNYLYSDPDGDPETGSELRWFRNGTEVAALAGSRTVDSSYTNKGELWRFTVRPKDGVLFGALQTSPAVTIGNTAPRVTAADVSPANPRTDDALQAVYAYVDPDSDPETGSQIRWYRNGLEQTSLLNATSVPPSATRKNEVWYYRVWPNDGTDQGAGEISNPAFIDNTAPIANAGPDQSITPTQPVMRVTLDGAGTVDADGDVIDYTWTEGATTLGRGVRVTVDLPVGRHTVTLTAADGEATSTDVVVIDMPDPKPSVSAPPNFNAAPGRVVLAGSGSDALGRTPSFQWRQVSGDPVTLNDATSATAWFFALGAGARTFELVATVGSASSDPVRTTVTTRNVAPWASAPPRQIVLAGSEVSLDGADSSDPNGETLTFHWTLESSLPGVIADELTPVAKLTPTADGTYSVVLVVNDGVQDSAPAATQVLAIDPAVRDHPPVANAGLDAVDEVGRTITLDGQASYDIDGDTLVYQWRRISGPGTEPTPSSSPTPTFKATGAGTVVLGLTVTDGKTVSPEDTVQVEISDPAVNHRPTARAGSDQVATVGATVRLDGSRSVDPDGDSLTYQWSQLSGPAISFDDPTASKPSFTAVRPGLVRLALVVSDGRLTSAASTLAVQVTTSSNHAPLAIAGPDQQVALGAEVQLDGTASSDPDGDALRFRWEQVLGSPVVLSGSGGTPTFTPPGKGRYRFRLTVHDAEVQSLPDEVDVLVSTHGAGNRPPVATAGTDLEVTVGDRVLLDGSGSSDPDALDKLTYEWTLAAFPTGGEPALADTATAKPSFTPAVPGPYTLRLRVSDGDLSSAPAYVTVLAVSKSGRACGCGAGDGAPLALAGMLALLALRRRQKAVVVALGVALLALAPAVAQAARSKKTTKPATRSAPAGSSTTTVEPEPQPESAPPPARGQEPAGPPNPFFDEARELYMNFQFEGILPKLEFALAVKGVTPAQKIEIYKLMAFTHAAFDDSAKAEEAFLRILEIDPSYELTGGASPKIRASFANAQKTHRARQAVKLEHQPPKPAAAGTTTTVDVVARAGADRVASMMLHYRVRGRSGGYSQLSMVKGEGGAFSANVPNAFPGPAGKQTVEYFIRARDRSGALIAAIGDEGKPLEMEMETVQATSGEPLYKSWVFWSAVGVAAASAVAVPVLLRRDAPLQTGTLGAETLK